MSAFLLTALLGLLIVLLLLSMIIARFSLTVATIANSIDAIYKLKSAQTTRTRTLTLTLTRTRTLSLSLTLSRFAQMTVLYTARLRSSQLAPQPFNLLRRAMLVAYALTEVPGRSAEM